MQEDEKITEEENKIEELPQEESPTLEQELADFKDKYYRVLAELENTRKRLYKEKTEQLRLSVENTVSEFLPIIDNFEKALSFAENTSGEVKSWASGFQMFLTQFKDILHNHGIVAFHSEGNFFDPHLHEAVEMEETEDFQEGMILEEFSKGYKSHNRTIRPARVKVAKKIPPKEEEPLEEPKQEEKE